MKRPILALCLWFSAAAAALRAADISSVSARSLTWETPNICNDVGAVYDWPQWTADWSYPITLDRANSLHGRLRCYVSPPDAAGTFYLLGTASNGLITFGPTPCSVISGGFGEWVVSSTPLPNYVSIIYLDVNWQFSLDLVNWTSVGTTSNPLFVTLGPAIPDPPSGKLYDSVLRVACMRSGATDRDTAMLNTWWSFGNVHNYQHQRLYYYLNDGVTTFGQNAEFVDYLLGGPKRTGGCSAWTRFLGACLLAHGIVAWEIEEVKPSQANLPDRGFLVNNWQADGAGFDLPYCYRVWTTAMTGPFDMVPCPGIGPNLGYGDLSSLAGIQGQNSDTPSQKAFGSHQIVKFWWLDSSHSYLDPSYMQSYADANDMEGKAVARFSTAFQPDPPPPPYGPMRSILVRDANLSVRGDLVFTPDSPP